MRSSSTLFPPVPEDTACAAGSLYGKGNIYLRVGEVVDQLFFELSPLEMEIHSKRTEQASALYALMTAIQFAEKFSDHQMVEAVRNRADLKYALHLPMSYPRFDPKMLCEFRQYLSAEPASKQSFRTLLDRLAELGLLKTTEEQPLCPARVLDEICTCNRLEVVLEAMYQSLETLAVTNSEWLRQITLPHWYERYNRRKHTTFCLSAKGKWKGMALEIGADIQYLLGEIDRSGLACLISLREIQCLRQTWEEQFVAFQAEATHTPSVQWRSTCAYH